MEKHWEIGEKGAQESLNKFNQKGIKDYTKGRNFPVKKNVSRLSPHLHFGEISPIQVWYKTHEKGKNEEVKNFCR